MIVVSVALCLGALLGLVWWSATILGRSSWWSARRAWRDFDRLRDEWERDTPTEEHWPIDLNDR